MTRLKQLSLLVPRNKLLACPTSADTVIMDNYQHDIFTDPASLLIKADTMIGNIGQLMGL